MRLLLSAARVFQRGGFARMDVSIEGERIARVAPFIDPQGFDRTIDCSDLTLLPGLVDVHVHLREPGFSYKETVKTGTGAAARGGYTQVCAMPNLNPAPDTYEHLLPQQRLIERDALVKVAPYGTITVGQRGRDGLSDLDGLRPHVCGYSDDGRGVQRAEDMLEAMRRVKALNSIIAAHCEDERELLPGGAVHDGIAARRFGLTGINSRSEWVQLERDLALARRTGCRYHACHISTKESVELVREAKRAGVDVSCETAPHYLLLSDEDIEDEGRFKMNPPIRAKADREALVEGLLDGTIDMIATDHAPHSAEEKAGGLKGSVMGVVGLECAFALMYTHFVKNGLISLEKLVELMSLAPRRRFGFAPGLIRPGEPADLTLMDLNAEYSIDPAGFTSMGRATPFEGWQVCGRAMMTLVDGRIAQMSAEARGDS